MVEFAKLTVEELALALSVAIRAQELFQRVGVERERGEIVMDLALTHNACPIDFERLAEFSDGDFAHDISGISRHLNRITGELEDCFVPRCALRQEG